MQIIHMNFFIIIIYNLMSISDLCHVSFHLEVGQFNIFYIDSKKICCLFYFGPNYEISVKDVKN